MNIVFDSNVLIAAFATHGVCHLLVEVCLLQHDVQLSDFVLAEVTEKLEHKIKLPGGIIQKISEYLREHSQHHNPAPSRQQISRDPDDDPILMLAEETDAQYIITGDKDLLILKSHCKTRIVSPREFADILRDIEI